jgi:hypothetical protein
MRGARAFRPMTTGLRIPQDRPEDLCFCHRSDTPVPGD